MTMTTHDYSITDKYGRRTRRDGTVQSGDTLHVPIKFMDSDNPALIAAMAAAQTAKRVEQFDASHADHRPGFRLMDAGATTTSEQRRSERDAKLADAWKRPRPVIDQATGHHAPPAKTTPTHDELIATRDRRLEGAWRR